MTIQPDITTPLVIGPQNQTANTNLGHLAFLVGTWNSPQGDASTGYNVMPLPQAGAPGGYILKNLPYYEEITFAPAAGGAANRGGTYTQHNNILFYEQRVYFAANEAPTDAPSTQDKLTHAENGTWLYRTAGPQLDGAYGPGTLPLPTPSPEQNPATQYVKQVSVPHGNSLLLVGQATVHQGSPVFPARPTTPPFDRPVTDPVSALSNQLDTLGKQGISVNNHIRIDVSSTSPGGGISNVHFEAQHATVDSMQTSWFIEFLSNGTIQLQYYQLINMKLLINRVLTPFLHSDANTLLPAGGQLTNSGT